MNNLEGKVTNLFNIWLLLFSLRDREEEVTFLKDCLKVRKGIESTDWSFDSLPDRSSRRVSRRIWNREDIWNMSIHTFKTDLKYWSYRIPPGYNNRYNFPVSNARV